MAQHYKNEIELAVVKAIEWIKKNRGIFFTSVAVISVLVVMGVYISSRLKLTVERSGEKFAMAQGMYSQGLAEQSATILNEVVTQYPKTTAADQSRLILAEINLNNKKYDEAIALSRYVYEKGNPKSIRPFAIEVMISAMIEKGVFEEAVLNCNLFLEKYSDHYLAPRAYELLAFSYRISGMDAEARRIYEKIVTLYPSSPWSEKSRARLEGMGK